MKFLALVSAGLIAAAATAPVAAEAQAQHRERVVTRNVQSERHAEGGYRNRTRRVCSTKWRDHHRVRTCRTVRY